MGIRVAPAIAARLIAESLVPRLGLIELTAGDTIEVLCACARVRRWAFAAELYSISCI